MIDGGDFTEADDLQFPPIPFKLKWRDPTTGDSGEETFETKPRVPMGVLYAVEAQDARGIRGVLINALRDDDGEKDKKSKLPKPGTSSKERFEALIFHDTREIPGQALTNVLRELYITFATRRSSPGAPPVPTSAPEPSSVRRLPTGNGSTGKRSGRGSTSRGSRQTVG